MKCKEKYIETNFSWLFPIFEEVYEYLSQYIYTSFSDSIALMSLFSYSAHLYLTEKSRINNINVKINNNDFLLQLQAQFQLCI